MELPTRALPFTPSVLVAFFGALRRSGELRIAAASVSGFNVLSRAGELVALTRGQVKLGELEAVIAFEHTERWQIIGVGEPVVVRDSSTLTLLRLFCSGLRPGDTLIQCSERRWRSVHAYVAAVLDL